MKIARWQHLVDIDDTTDDGTYTSTSHFQQVEADIRRAITAVVWPPSSRVFSIRPVPKGNGVKPIKAGFVSTLKASGWQLEKSAPRATVEEDSTAKGSRPGAFDCHFTFVNNRQKPFVVEWETGNISSSHRAVNRIGLGLLHDYVSGGVLIVPSDRLYPFLTDRIGNERELRPYLPLWRLWMFHESSYFGIVSVEQDADSTDIPPIPKGTDGWALVVRIVISSGVMRLVPRGGRWWVGGDGRFG
jgi:hypothetical protein